MQVLRAIVYPLVADPADLGPDGATHVHIAGLLAAQGFPWPAIDPALSTQLYVLGLADLFRVTGPSVTALRWVNVALWLATLWLALGLYKPLLGRTLALVATATLALDDPFAFIKYAQYELLLLVLALAGTKIFLEAVGAGVDETERASPAACVGPESASGPAAMARAANRRSEGPGSSTGTGRAAASLCLAGIAFGLASLTQGKALLLAPVVWGGWALTVLLALPAGGRTRHAGAVGLRLIRTGIPVVLGLALAVAPWAYRNFLVTGRPLLTSSNGGMTFYLGNNPYAGGTLTYPPPDRWPVDRSLPMEAQDPLLYRAGWDYIRAHPLREIFVLIPLKLSYLFDLWRPSAAASGTGAGEASGAAAFLGQLRLRNIAVLGLFLAGLWVAWRRGLTPAQGALVSIVVYITLLHALFYGWGRHRFPALPAMHAFVAIALGALAAALAGRRRPVAPGAGREVQ